jgi:aconitate hydratase
MPQLAKEPSHSTQRKFNVTLRIDMPIEDDYYVHGGIQPYVLRQLLVA